MKAKILGVVGLVWGGVILIRFFFFSLYEVNPAYKAGRYSALIFGFIIIILGIYSLFKKKRMDSGSENK